ncbi:T9SS type B sorting domain-containing protein [Flavivirga aquimarina]|uniref:T9SS type B sorting domain-containing protein n=1 Tax=Flavivirga aquimarina TaxID=2027862 RepID=A0ABT8W9Y8_9FLAO|nr:T9SS type B sorting domain-containing protein [Flavivirga aquimarina]MDO5969958.1 T9SS type B sorting domain-containing protein [Flavivirga aquimarina]
MQSNILYKKILLLFIITITTQGYSQLNKTHYIPPLTSAEFGNANPEDQYIYISTPSTTNIPFTIMPVGQPTTSNITGNVSNTNPQRISIGSGNGQLFIPSSQTSVVVNNRGYIIEAESPIYVSVRMNAGSTAQAGALVSKGISALGTTFRVGSYTNENPQDNYLNFASVMATEDNTQVSFSDLPAGIIIKNYSGTTPINTTLNKGESYTIATNSSSSVINHDGLIGCLISSDKPIVVSCGSTNGSFHNGGGRDYGIDQIVGLSKVGTEYIFVKGDGNNDWENILIVAHTDNTTISINGNAPVTTINAGEYYLIEGNNFNTSGNMYVETSAPVFAYQGVGATTSEANQGMFFVPPLSCEARGNLDNIANIEDIGNTNYTGGVTIVTKSGATVTINNTPISSFSTIGPSTVTGKTDYVTYKVTGLTGNISVESSDELYCAYFNFNGAATSGSFYSGFPSPPEINFDAQFATLGNCIPNITLEAANTQNFDSFEWWFDDGTGFQNQFISTPFLTPTLPGKYKLIGVITCTLERLESAEVPVSICPDDTDNDGIIDNIDIDNDNDGILNCIESNGDVTVNIADKGLPPRLLFQDNTTNTTITSSSFTQNNSSGNNTANTITGTATGGFTSIVQPAANAESTYTLNFTESVNVKFMEDTAITHVATTGEFFIAKILPANKNITLIDPDNRLLVDTNFDGVFETGVTQISGSEIHYKINPAPLGNTPYQFFANQVDGFSFIHKLSNTTTASTFSNGIISLTCFKKDTDLDGVKDEIDLDSDNDGIPDNIENNGLLEALSGIDIDANGLDDIYDINVTPLDSDNDTIFDFYDLDSDNDGIYDLIESGQLNTLLFDANLDGIEDGPAYGVNGWADAAETASDSNLIGYTPNDLDNDTIYSYIDLDSDGDTCSDVIEAGFSDANGNDLLGGDNPVTINASGLVLVTNTSDGYTIPNSDYLDFATITITTQPIDTEVCEFSNTTISIATSAMDTIQWELSTDGINWNPIVDDAIYSGTQTVNLNISNTPISYNTYQYRAFLNLAGNSCGFYSDEIELTVHPLPIVNSPVTLVQCDNDDPTTLGFSPFNLTEANNEISTNASNETFTYFLTQAAATLGDTTSPDYINDPITFINRTVSTDIVWARVESSFGCAQVSEIQLNVSTTAIPSTFLETFNQCDDFLDINGLDNTNNDDRDGIATFDFSSVTNIVLSSLPSNALQPRYYRNEADALAEINEITDITNYRNIGYPGSQYIYIRVDSAVSNDCLGLGAHVLLNVEALPIANDIVPFIECDNDTDPTNGFSFNTTTLETDLLNGQSLTDVSVSYFDASGNPLRDFDGNLISSPFPNTFLSTSQTITARVTNNTTAALDGPCYDETTITFRVDVQPIANQVAPQIVCDGDMGDVDDDGYYPFDTSTFTNTILGSQLGTMDIYYDYIDENGNSVVDATSLPNPLNSQNQIITVDVVNPINAVCSDPTEIELTVNPLPEFTVETPRIVCSSEPSFTVTLSPEETDITETFTYTWHWDNLDGTITNQLISNERTITESNAGTYYITLTKTDGTGCPRTREIFVDASEQATITYENIDISAPSYNHTVSIIDPSILGFGEYDYALQEEESPFIVFQDEPIFYNVTPGFYTLHIRDKVCPTTMFDIAVIGHNQFFTPNGDSVNDYWKIKGIGATNQSNSVVLIFDRYGKLLKQISPLEPGWDGTFNGTQLPTDDYWFRVYLEDGREFSGHFTLKR